MRILWISDGGSPTGFGTVTHAIGERLVSDYGHDVHVLASNYRGDHVDTNLKLYVPNFSEKNDIYGWNRHLELLGSIAPECVVFLNDPVIVVNSLLNNRWDSDKVFWRGLAQGEVSWRVPIVTYMPIDGYNIPKVWDILARRTARVAMSHFGQQTMPEAPVIWHGVDTSIFHPRNKTESKRALGLDPDRFLILRVDKNSPRKNYADTWRALRPLLRKYTDIDVWFHCQINPIDGVNLMNLTYNDEDIRDRINYSPRVTGWTGWGIDELAMLYSAADLFVSTSWGEGFGLTLLEAMASGVPVVAQDCSAVTEVVGPGGVLVEPQRQITVPAGHDQMLPNVDAFTDAIEKLYLSRGARRALGEKAVAHASQFTWDEAARRMNDVIEREVARALPEQQRPAESAAG
jgi:glycosyltransferase involved in cell wall biosynthesis